MAIRTLLTDISKVTEPSFLNGIQRQKLTIYLANSLFIPAMALSWEKVAFCFKQKKYFYLFSLPVLPSF